MNDIGNARVWESQHQKLLGVTIDKNLKFNNHISDICMKAGRKLTALGRLNRLLPFNKRHLLIKSFSHSFRIVHWYGCFMTET